MVEGILTVPYIVSDDDLQVLNPLGGHSNPYAIGCVYGKIGCLPPDISSKLSSINPLQLYYTKDRKRFSSYQVFKPLVEELKKICGQTIEYMIPVEHDLIHHVRVIPYVIEGDNKSIHEVAGFVESFQANFPCKDCYAHRDEIKIMFSLDQTLLRSEKEHILDTKYKDVQHTGVIGPSAFSEISGFSALKNVGPDILHDLPEGVERYEVAEALDHFIKKNFFDLDKLNRRLAQFKFCSSVKNKLN